MLRLPAHKDGGNWQVNAHTHTHTHWKAVAFAVVDVAAFAAAHKAT